MNLPNALSLSRLLFVPLILWLAWPNGSLPGGRRLAALLYALCAIIDAVDGYLARKMGQVTDLGKHLDPLVDKIIYLLTLLALTYQPGNTVPLWVVMAFITRELTVTGLRGIAATEGIVIAAGRQGKTKTLFANVGAILLLWNDPVVLSLSQRVIVRLDVVGEWLTLGALAFAVVSGIQYISEFARALGRRVRAENSKS